ncbi:hypothetical protein D3C71_955310 [compost metagenome]
MNLALGIHHQAIHVLVRGHIDRAAARLIAIGKTIEEQFVRAIDGIGIDDFEGFRVEGDDFAANGVEDQKAVESHAHAKVEVDREISAALDLFVVVQRFRQQTHQRCSHARVRFFRIELIDAENLPATGTDEGIFAGQHRIQGAATQLIVDAADHSIRLPAHIVEQTLLVLVVEQPLDILSLLQALSVADLLKLRQLQRHFGACHFNQLAIDFVVLAQAKAGPPPRDHGVTDLVDEMRHAARIAGQVRHRLRCQFVGTTRHRNLSAVGLRTVPMRLIAEGLGQIRVHRRGRLGRRHDGQTCQCQARAQPCEAKLCDCYASHYATP